MVEDNNTTSEEYDPIDYIQEVEANNLRLYTLFGVLAVGLILLVMWLFARVPVEIALGKPKPPPHKIRTAPTATPLPPPDVRPPAPSITPPSAPIITPLPLDKYAVQKKETEEAKQ